MTGRKFFTRPKTIGFWRWPLLHVVSRFVSVCNMMFDFSCLISILVPKPSLALSPFPSPRTFTTLIISSLFQHSLQNFIQLALPYSPLLCFLSVSAVFHSLHFRFFFSSCASLLCLFVSTIFYFNPLFQNFHPCSFYAHLQNFPFQQHLFLLPNL